jgi:hypothetical protein
VAMTKFYTLKTYMSNATNVRYGAGWRWGTV